MDFEELEAWWNSDVGEDVHTRPADLRARAVSTAREAELTASFFEIGMSAIFGFAGLIALFDAFHDAEPWHSYPPALITLGIVLFILHRRHVRRQAVDFSNSLTGVVDDGLRSVTCQMFWTRSFLWWFVVPTMLAVGINMAFSFDGRPVWVWLIQPFGILALYVALLTEMKTSHLPRLQALRAIKEALAAEAGPASD